MIQQVVLRECGSFPVCLGIGFYVYFLLHMLDKDKEVLILTEHVFLSLLSMFGAWRPALPRTPLFPHPLPGRSG